MYVIIFFSIFHRVVGPMLCSSIKCGKITGSNLTGKGLIPIVVDWVWLG